MDERQQTVTKTYTREDMLKMSVEEFSKIIGEAGPNVVFHGTAVVRKADGSIRYDEGAVPGNFGEAAEDLPAGSAE